MVKLQFAGFSNLPSFLADLYLFKGNEQGS